MSKNVVNNLKTACRVAITTTIDGKDTDIIRSGEMMLSENEWSIIYREESAEVTIVCKENCVRVERRGDYSLILNLKEGVEEVGEIGMSGASGEVSAYAQKIVYSVNKTSLLAVLHYDLIIGKERQETKLRLYAKQQ